MAKALAKEAEDRKRAEDDMRKANVEAALQAAAAIKPIGRHHHPPRPATALPPAGGRREPHGFRGRPRLSRESLGARWRAGRF